VATGLVGATVAGYRIEEVAGRGGMGVVYRAWDSALERSVALKVIAPEFSLDAKYRKRFVREALATARLDHPNVIPVYDAGEDDDGQLYIAMRFVDGEDLGTLLHQSGALAPALAAEIVAQAASALDAAHARGLVHRDVKPANVLIAHGGRPHVYLTDFGLAKWEETTGSGLTSTGGWMGTPDYLAPEQIEGETPDARTDVYALGCVLFAALTGRPPFADVPRMRKATAHMQDPPPSLRDVAPGVPKAFEPVVRRALAKDPGKRYQSAGELGTAALQQVAGRRSQVAGITSSRTRKMEPGPTVKLVTPRKRRRRRHRGVFAAVFGLALAAIAALIAVAVLGSDGSKPQHRTTRHHRAAPKPPPAPTAAEGTVRCSANSCTQAGHKVEAPIEDGTCANDTGSWVRIDASGSPLIVCMAADNPPDGSAPQLSTVPDVIDGQLDLVHDYLDGLAINHDTSGGGLFGIIDNSAYEVCATSPPVGSPLPPDGKVQLYAKHSC
jgi:protein kinase-like protein